MSLKKRVRCGKCKAVLQFTLRTNAAVQVTCVRCGAVLRIPASDSATGEDDACGEQFDPESKDDGRLHEFDSNHASDSDDSQDDTFHWGASEDPESAPSQLPPRRTNVKRSREEPVAQNKAISSLLIAFRNLPVAGRLGIMLASVVPLVVLVVLCGFLLIDDHPEPETVGTNSVTTAPIMSAPSSASAAAVSSSDFVDLDIKTVHLQKAYDQFAVNETARELAAIETRGNELHVYAAESLRQENPQPVTHTIPAACQYMVFKPIGSGGYYCILDDAGAVLILDAEKKSGTRSVDFGRISVAGLLASKNPDDPWIFVVKRFGNPMPLTAIQVETGEIVENVGMIRGMTAVISDSGRWIAGTGNILLRNDLRRPPSNLQARAIQGEVELPSFTPLFFANQDQFLIKGDMIVDTVAAAQTIVTLKNNTLRPVAPRCAFRDIPVMIGSWVSDRNTQLPIEHPGQILLSTASTNTFTRFKKTCRLEFSPDWYHDMGAPSFRAANMPQSIDSEISAAAVDSKLTLLPDNANRQLYCVLGRELKIVPAAELAGTDSQRLDFPTIASGPYPPGRTLRVPLKVASSAVKTSVETPLPEGAALEPGEFVWTPPKVQASSNVLTFVYDSSDSHRSLNVKVVVDFPLATIPGNPESIIPGAATGALYSLDSDHHSIARIEINNVEDVPECTETARFKTGANIVAFTEKRYGSASFLCVATAEPSAIHVLAAESLQKLAEIPISFNSGRSLYVSSNSADPHVYYSSRSETTGAEATGAIQLTSMSDIGIVSGLKDLTLISPDGRIAIDSSARIALLKHGFGGASPEFEPWTTQRITIPISENVIMDSQSTIVASLGRAFSLFRSETGVLVPDKVVSLRDDFAVTMKLAPEDVIITRHNYSPEPAEEHSFTVSLPMSTSTNSRRSNSTGSTFAYVDFDRERIIVCRGGRLAIRPLSALGIGTEPPMNAEFVPGAPFIAGVKSTQKLQPLHAEDTVEIESLADGMQANGNDITWTPGRNQKGNELIQFRVRRGGRIVNRTAFVAVAGSKHDAEMMMAGAGKSPTGVQPVEKPRNDLPAATAAESVAGTPEPGRIAATASNTEAGTTVLLCENAPQVRLFRTADIESGPVGNGTASLTLKTAVVDVVSKQIGQQQAYVILTGGKGLPSVVYIVDAAALQKIQKFPLSNVEGTALTTSEAVGDPWIFCVANSGSAPDAPGILLGLNPEAGSVAPAIADNVGHAAISADGKSLILAGQAGSDSLRWMTRVTPFAADNQRFRRWKDSPVSYPKIVLSPAGDFALCGTVVHDSGLQQFGGKLPAELLTPVFLHNRAVLVGIQVQTNYQSTTQGTTKILLRAFDARNFEAVEQSVTLDQFDFSKKTEKNSPVSSFRLIADEKAERMICVTHKEFITAQFDEMQIPQTGYLSARFHSDSALVTESPAEIRLELPENNPPLQISRTDLLPGMELKGNTITWTPPVTAIGLSEISITVSDGKQSQISRMVVNVVRPENHFSGNQRFAALSTLDGSLIVPDAESRRILRYGIDGMKLVEDTNVAITLDAPLKVLRTKQFGNKHLVLVGIDSKTPLKIFDAGTFRSVAEIAIHGWVAGELTASQNPEDPFVYFEREDGIHALSLKTMTDQGLAIPDATEFVIGSSGTFGYARLRQPDDKSVLMPAVLSNSFESSVPQFSLPMERDGYHNTVGSVIPDEYGMTAILDGSLKDAILSQPAAHSRTASSFFGVGFLHRGGTLLSLSRGRESTSPDRTVPVSLVASSAYSDAEIYGKVIISESLQAREFSRSTPPDWRILPDERNERILCLGNGEAVIVELKDLRIPEQTPLMGVLSGPHQIEVGRPQTWSLLGVPDDATVGFPVLPDGSVQAESQITWTPSSDQIGLHKIRVELKRGREQKTLDYEINVAWQTLTLPFSPVGIATEETGPRVAVWQRSAIVDDHVIDNNCGQLCVVNTASKKQLFSGNMLPRNPLGRIVGGAIAGDRFVFYNQLPDESELWSMPLDGSALAQQMEIPGDRRKSVVTLSIVGRHLLLEFTDRLMFFNAATLKFEREIRPAEGMIPRPVVDQSLFGQSIYGVVVDESLVAQLAVRSPWYADPLIKTDARPSAPVAVSLNRDEDSTPKLSRGEMRISVVFSADPAEPDSKTQQPATGVPLPERKLVQHWSHRISGELRFENALGTILTRPLGKMNFRLFDEFIGCHYYPRVADVVVCAGRRLMLLPFPKPDELKDKGASLVAAVIPQPGNVVIPSTTKTTLIHELLGDARDLTTVNQSLQVEGLEFLPHDRSIVIDGPRLKRALTMLRVAACLDKPGAAAGTPAERAESIVTELKDQQRAQAEGVLKYQGDDLLEAVPIVIELQDNNKNVIYKLSYFVFVELSVTELQRQIANGSR